MKKVSVIIFLSLVLQACSSKEGKYVGFWSVSDDNPNYLEIQRSGDVFVAIQYFYDENGNIKSTEIGPVLYKDGILVYERGDGFPRITFYIDEEGNLNADGKILKRLTKSKEKNKKSGAGPKVETSAISDPIEAGKLIYTNSCATCHGADGKLGLNGAKDLSVTQLSAEDQKTIIRNGKNAMPGYKDLTDEQLDAVVQFIGTLKQ